MKRTRRSDMPNNSDNSNNDNYDFSSSTILTSKYGHESTRLIHVIEKNLLVIMAIIVAMAVVSILNTLGVLEYLYSHDADYVVDVVLSVILVVVLVPLIILLLKSRRTLDRWTDMFERNTIVTTMNIAMTNRSKEEAILALPHSIQQIKERVKERYGKMALTGNNSDCCCCCSGVSQEECASENGSLPMQSVKAIGYDTADIESIPQSSILGVGCGAPTKFSDIRQGETVVDLGSGAGIDVFLSANRVGESGKVIGIDMTDEMLEKASKNAKDNNDYTTNVEFRKGDIEKRIPVEDNTVDLVISNCVISLTTDKVNTFKEI
jgi:SAM-dependent methyltransferase